MNRVRLDKVGRRRIADAVKDAESKTSGEIVVVLDRSAERYHDTMAFVALGAVAVLYAAGNYRTFEFQTGAPQWQVSPASWLAPLPTLLTWVIGLLGAWLVLDWVPALARPFVGRDRMRRAAHKEAWRAFGERSVYATRGRTGVLVYVAEFERAVVVIGDTAISAQVTDQDWEPVRDAVLEGYKTRKPLEGIVSAIALAGELLAKHCPLTADDTDELPDEPTRER